MDTEIWLKLVCENLVISSQQKEEQVTGSIRGLNTGPPTLSEYTPLSRNHTTGDGQRMVVIGVYRHVD